MKKDMMGKKQLVINLASNIIAVVTALGISFILTPYLIINLGKEAYSFYPISTNFVNYMTIVAIALNSMASRFITIEVVKSNNENAISYYSSAFYANLILAGVLSLPMALIVAFVDKFMKIPTEIVFEVKILFALVFISLLINIVSNLFGAVTFIRNRMDIRAGYDIVQSVLRAVLFLIFFISFRPSIAYVGVVALIISITRFFAQMELTRKLLPDFKISLKYFDIKKVFELLRSGIWNSINSLGSVLLIGMALLLANIFIGADAAGDLSIVQTMPTIMATVISAVYAVFLPRITNAFAKGDRKTLINEVVFSQKMLGLIATAPAVLIIVFGKEFFKLWLPNQNSEYLQVLSIITIIPLLIHSNMWTVYGLTVTSNKLRVPSLVLIAAGALNVVLAYLLLSFTDLKVLAIPIVSSTINIVFYMIFLPIYISSQLELSKFTFYKHIIRSVIFSVIIITLGIFVKQFLIIERWVDFFLWGGIFGIITLGINCIFVLNRNDFSKIKNLIQKTYNKRI